MVRRRAKSEIKCAPRRTPIAREKESQDKTTPACRGVFMQIRVGVVLLDTLVVPLALETRESLQFHTRRLHPKPAQGPPFLRKSFGGALSVACRKGNAAPERTRGKGEEERASRRLFCGDSVWWS